MGMAFQSVSKYGADSVFQTLVSQGAVPEPVFAFKLASSGSELRVGGVNSALYKGSFTYTPVTQQVSYRLHLLRYLITLMHLSGVLANCRRCHWDQWNRGNQRILRRRRHWNRIDLG